VLSLPYFFVGVKLPNESFCGAGIEDVDNAGLEHFVEADRIVATIVEYFNNILVDHNISQHLFGEPECLKIAELVHVPYINEKSVATVIQLNHLHKSSLA
jgi:hypothetical protein